MPVGALGLWLVGVGAFIGCVLLLTEPVPSITGGRGYNSPGSARPLRIRAAARLLAALLGGTGAVVTAAAQTPPWYVVIATLVGAAAFMWLHCSVSQHHAWLAAARGYGDMSIEDFEPGLQPAVTTARLCSTWRWALRHPFNGQPWPGRRLKQP